MGSGPDSSNRDRLCASGTHVAAVRLELRRRDVRPPAAADEGHVASHFGAEAGDISVRVEALDDFIDAQHIDMQDIHDMISANGKRLHAFGEDHKGRSIDTIDEVGRGCDLLLTPGGFRG